MTASPEQSARLIAFLEDLASGLGIDCSNARGGAGTSNAHKVHTLTNAMYRALGTVPMHVPYSPRIRAALVECLAAIAGPMFADGTRWVVRRDLYPRHFVLQHAVCSDVYVLIKAPVPDGFADASEPEPETGLYHSSLMDEDPTREDVFELFTCTALGYDPDTMHREWFCPHLLCKHLVAVHAHIVAHNGVFEDTDGEDGEDESEREEDEDVGEVALTELELV